MGSKKQTRKVTAPAQNTTNSSTVHPKSSIPSTSTDNEEEGDFCQKYFGDPLFSNFNVLLLFLLATFLPMLVWIPHFINEYAQVRQSTIIEGERLKRVEQSRLELMSGVMETQMGLNRKDSVVLPDGRVLGEHEEVINTPFGEEDVAVYEEDVFGLKSNDGRGNDDVSVLSPRKPTVLPTLCSDGKTIGFDNWFTLRDAIFEANALAAEDFLRWNKYLVMSLQDPTLEEPVFPVPDPFTICPFAKLNQRHPPRVSFVTWLKSFFIDTPSNQYKPNRNKLSSIFINAEDITIQCDRCVVDLPGTHFSFGPHARNVWIKGITFKGATTSSLTLHHHGATASFEDCYWFYNSGGIVTTKNNPIGSLTMDGGNVGGTMNAGAVADVNSTSSITFYRCSIDDQRQNPRRATVGAGELGTKVN